MFAAGNGRENSTSMSQRILLVDDEPSIRVVLGAILQEAGYVVDTAEDGLHALRQISTALPDLVITDLRMPNMNGFELLEALRARLPAIPRIVISGEFLATEVDPALAHAFFQKGSYSIPDFLARIAELLAASRESAQAAAASAAAGAKSRAAC